MKQKKYFIFSGLLIVVTGLVGGLVWFFQPTKTKTTFKEMYQGIPMVVIWREKPNFKMSFDLASLEECCRIYSYDFPGLGLDDIFISGRKSAGGDDLYDFCIVDQGMPREINNFHYSGEQTKTIARGVDWFIQITKEFSL